MCVVGLGRGGRGELEAVGDGSSRGVGWRSAVSSVVEWNPLVMNGIVRGGAGSNLSAGGLIGLGGGWGLI